MKRMDASQIHRSHQKERKKKEKMRAAIMPFKPMETQNYSAKWLIQNGSTNGKAEGHNT